jgi:hypothetical protein
MNKEPDKMVAKVVEDIGRVFTELRPHLEEVKAVVEKL